MYGTPEEYYELAKIALEFAELRCDALEDGKRGAASAERQRRIAAEELNHAARIIRLASPPEDGVYIPMLWRDELRKMRAEKEKMK